ncbi:MAG: hypothetical protein CMJ62_05660 [Planctomycetaceae bacterium]|nr:hypothetical protein [Planctomycetaceae bacterium]
MERARIATVLQTDDQHGPACKHTPASSAAKRKDYNANIHVVQSVKVNKNLAENCHAASIMICRVLQSVPRKNRTGTFPMKPEYQ